MKVIGKDDDYEAIELVVAHARERFESHILSYCIPPNHWHLVLWPSADGELSRFVGWLSLTHTQRWHAHNHDIGSGHLCQGRFKSFAEPTRFEPTGASLIIEMRELETETGNLKSAICNC